NVRRPRQGQDAPSADPAWFADPERAARRARRQGALSFGYFSLREQRKVTRRKAKAFAVASTMCVRPEKQ
ncbi:hypothetical protein, partial [Xanthomonas sp. LMG 12461]|uniref:hypothetical protein n=1 Tax=Xanthomonas sp. LMG 12461 TaxID=2014543 RepID=UPI001D048CC5